MLFLVFDDQFRQFLVDQTNQYTAKKASEAANSTTQHPSCKPVTMEEMMGFTSIIFNMGTIQLPNIKDYWSTSDTALYHQHSFL